MRTRPPAASSPAGRGLGTALTLALALAFGAGGAAGCSDAGKATGSGGSGANGSGGTGSGGTGSGSGGSSPAASGGVSGGSGGHNGSGGSTSSGGSSGAASGGSTGSGSGGAPASGGSPGSGGSSSGGNGGRGGAGAGGAMSGTGGASAGSGGGAGSGASGGAAGGRSGVAPHGGSSARFVCAAGATYPASPLTGMGSPTMIKPDNATTPNYFAFVEGPLWIGSVGALFFSDNVSPERIWKLTGLTNPQVFLSMSGSNGLAVDNDDKLIVADQAGKRITRVNPADSKSVTVVVPAGNYKPNDVIVRSDGNIYFSDPDSGFYWYSTTGTLSSAMKQVSRPNGILLSLDENTLIVGDVGNKQIHTFALGADGSVMTGTDKLFATAMNDTVDGMCMDCAGNVYAATVKGIEVYSPTGSYIGLVPTGDSSNCTFGGADRKTLFTTSRSAVQAVSLGIPGLPD